MTFKTDQQRKAAFAKKGQTRPKSPPRPASKPMPRPRVVAHYPAKDYADYEPTADTDAARDLHLTAENDGDLYRSRYTPIHENLVKRLKKGTYDHEKAAVLWKYWADDAAQRYTKQFDAPPHLHGSYGIFDPATRRAVAKKQADDWLWEMNAQHPDLVGAA